MKEMVNFGENGSSQTSLIALTLCRVHVRQPDLHRLTLREQTIVSTRCSFQRARPLDREPQRETHLVIEIGLRDTCSGGLCACDRHRVIFCLCAGCVGISLVAQGRYEVEQVLFITTR